MSSPRLSLGNRVDLRPAPGTPYVNPATFMPGKHYLSELKCPVCGWTLTYDQAGPIVKFPLIKCENCKKRGFTSLMEKTNDGN